MTDAQRSGHQRWQSDTAAYALDALDEAEARAFEEHLAECRPCQDELTELRRTVGALPAAAPVLAPLPELRQRVMATVRAEAALRVPPHDAAERGISVPSPPWVARRPSWLTRGVAIVTAAALAVVTVVLAVTLIGGGAGAPKTYAGIVHAPGASASVLRSGQTGQLRFRGLPAPPTGRIYQVWLEHEQQPPQPTRTLFAASTGSVAVTGSLRGVQAILVTAEPRPEGSRVPTRPPIIVVRLA